MHSYQHNIKTFNNATRHLTRVERALYRDLIELYYDAEQPLPADDFDKLARRVMAVSDDEKAALQYVLDEFFVKTGEVYTHDYCDEQIDKYKAAVSAKARAGAASAEAKKARADARKNSRKAGDQQKSTPVEQVNNSSSTVVTNHKPETRNQNKEKDTATRLPADWVLTQEYYDAAKTARPEWPDNHVKRVADGFRDYWVAKSGKDATKLDWLATWRNWCRRDNTPVANIQPIPQPAKQRKLMPIPGRIPNHG